MIGQEVNNFFNYPLETDRIPAWEERNIICYESKWKMQNDSLAYEYLQADANRFFPFSVKVETKEVQCYILKKGPDFKSTKSVNKEPVFEYSDSSYILRNLPVSNIIESLNDLEIFKEIPVVDETNYSLNIDVHLANVFTDITTLKKQLRKNGLLLEGGKRKIAILLIESK